MSYVKGMLTVCITIFIVSSSHAGDPIGCPPCMTLGTDLYDIGLADAACKKGCLSNGHTSNDTDISHTYFSPRQTTMNNLIQNSLSLYWRYHRVLCEDDSTRCAIWVAPLFQQSTKGQKTGSYFFPRQCSQISVKQDGSGDVCSSWFNLEAEIGQQFSSIIAIQPERSVAGAYIDIWFDLSRYACHAWLEASFVPMQAKHKLNFCEDIAVPGALCGLTTVYDALNQEALLYGRFNASTLRKSGVDDIQVKLGYDWFYCDTDHVSPYLVFTIPTGSGSLARDLFEPVVGSNHASIGFGFIGDIRLWQDEHSEVTLLTDFKYRYVLRGCEKRSFDLCYNGDWSRYLQVVVPGSPSRIMPAIDACTQQIKSKPRSTVDWWMALHYQCRNWHLELNYDLWWRQSEYLKICCFPQNIGIYDIGGDCDQPPRTASRATIKQPATGPAGVLPDDAFVKTICADLNLNSGATPGALSNTLAIAFSRDCEWGNRLGMLAIGVLYEFGRNRAALNNWGIWAKVGAAF